MATAYDLLGGPAMPDVTTSIASADVRLWVSLDLHKFLDRRSDAAGGGR